MRLYEAGKTIPDAIGSEMKISRKESDMGSAIRETGKVLSLHLSKEKDGRRISCDDIVIGDGGVSGDKFCGKDPQRSILIAALDSYIMAKDAGIDMPYGSLGENILLDYNPYHLSPGCRFEIGDTLLEISQNCTLCKSLSRVHPKLPKLLKNDRGIFARVVRGGKIHTGDAVRIFEDNGNQRNQE